MTKNLDSSRDVKEVCGVSAIKPEEQTNHCMSVAGLQQTTDVAVVTIRPRWSL